VVKSRFGFRYGKSEILKLLRVPRGSVRGKMAKRRRRSVALQMALGTSALGHHRREGKIIFWRACGGILKKFRGNRRGGVSYGQKPFRLPLRKI
jgi:hypothetical protein